MDNKEKLSKAKDFISKIARSIDAILSGDATQNDINDLEKSIKNQIKIIETKLEIDIAQFEGDFSDKQKKKLAEILDKNVFIKKAEPKKDEKSNSLEGLSKDVIENIELIKDSVEDISIFKNPDLKKDIVETVESLMTDLHKSGFNISKNGDVFTSQERKNLETLLGSQIFEVKKEETKKKEPKKTEPKKETKKAKFKARNKKTEEKPKKQNKTEKKDSSDKEVDFHDFDLTDNHKVLRIKDTHYIIVHIDEPKKPIFDIVKNEDGDWTIDCCFKDKKYSSLKDAIKEVANSIYHSELKEFMDKRAEATKKARERKKERKEKGLPTELTPEEVIEKANEKVEEKIEEKIEDGKDVSKDIKQLFKSQSNFIKDMTAMISKLSIEEIKKIDRKEIEKQIESLKSLLKIIDSK